MENIQLKLWVAAALQCFIKIAQILMRCFVATFCKYLQLISLCYIGLGSCQAIKIKLFNCNQKTSMHLQLFVPFKNKLGVM